MILRWYKETVGWDRRGDFFNNRGDFSVSRSRNREQAKYNTGTELAMEEARKIINGEMKKAKSYESINEILDEFNMAD